MNISRVLATLLLAAAAGGCARSAAEPATREPPEPQAAGRPAAPDPGEQITPAELATIPEPVPASPDSPGTFSPRPQAGTLQRAPEGDSGRTEEGPKPRGKGSLWRVQVFATQDRDLAERTAREAAQLLHAQARVEYEGSRYKVRVGDFGSEDEAGELRDKAVRAGYPGAFRIRCAPDPTLNKD